MSEQRILTADVADDGAVPASERPAPAPAPTPARRSGKRIEGLDALRGLAALGVVFWHYASFGLGAYGPQLFFLISGFVIFMTVERTKRPVDFLISRFTRLYPAFWVSLVLAFVVACCFEIPGPQIGPAKRVLRFLVNTTMIPGWLSTPYFEGVYWTLEIEMTFYVIMFTLLLTNRIDRALPVLLALVALGAVMGLAHPWVQGRAVERFRRMAALDWMHYLTIGVLLYRIRIKPSLGNVALIGVLLLVPFTQYRPYQNPARDCLIGAAFALVVYLATTDRLPWLKHPVLVFLGTVSYTLYLTHGSVEIVLRDALKASGVPPGVAVALTTSAAIGVAALLTYLVEKPSLKTLRPLLERWARPAPPAATDAPASPANGAAAFGRPEGVGGLTG